MAGADGTGAEEAQAAEQPQSAEEWKRRGGEAYQGKDWEEAARCYSAALESCGTEGELGATCLNNRAACHAQLKEHAEVVRDATEVIRRQPANMKALLRRMVALDALGQRDEALADAASVLTMEPKNALALQVVEKKRKSLTKKASDMLPQRPQDQPKERLCVFLFSEDRPLQCYACLRSLFKRVKHVCLSVYVFWQASESACAHSYQLLQSLDETSRTKFGKVCWVETSQQKLFPAFSRTLNRLSVEGHSHVLFLADTVLFHTDVDASVALRVLTQRREAFSVRLDVNPRIEYFPEGSLLAVAPRMQHFAEDPRVTLWTRWYDKSKPAYESVGREMGWDAILDWTATIVNVHTVQHHFSALVPPINNLKELDDKAADWLSKRQRMKQSELSHRSACYVDPVLVTLDPAEFGDALTADGALRAHLRRRFDPHGAFGAEGLNKLAGELKWKLQEVMDYFKDVDAQAAAAVPLEGLLEPERYREHYLYSVRAPAAPPSTGLPKALGAPAPLVSWLVPVRSMESYVLDCLRSIEAQEGVGAGCCEVVVVDDSSEDSTPAVLRRFAAERPHVRIVENGMQLGVAGSLCEGWRQCRGDFVARLDADDEAEPDRLLKQLRYLEQHKSISVLGGRVRSFWTEERKCTIDRVVEKDGGRMVAVAWREDFGNQTSRQREQITFYEKGGNVLLQAGPAEYHGCRAVRIGDELLALSPETWREALRSVQGKNGEVILQRRDPLEPPSGSRIFHPALVHANLIFEDCIAGTTATLRRSHFGQEDGPFQREEAEGHWLWLSLNSTQHAANLADPIVRARRHVGNRADRDASGIYESRCAAVQYHLTKAYGVDFDMHDAAATLNFRGPRTAEQGDKILEVLQRVQRRLFAERVRPTVPAARDEFWTDYIQGREKALERAIMHTKVRFHGLVEAVKETITSVPENSPREKRSRTPPR